MIVWSRLCIFLLGLKAFHALETLRDPLIMNSLIRVSDMNNFVGFSYSRASPNPASERFIHFMKENFNINANFLPNYGSFRVSRPGVYFFTFSFLTQMAEEAVVALRLNGETLVSAISEAGGHNPTSQSTLVSLSEGDVVQLEVLQGRVYETNRPEFAQTAFTGYLIALYQGSILDDNSILNERSFYDNSYQARCCQECCRREPPFYGTRPSRPTQRPSKPPRPEYRPPPYPPTTPRPPYIYTTKTPDVPYHRENCCDSVIITAKDGRSRSLQGEKFGVYRLVKIEPSDGRAVFKHCENEVYIYYYNSPSGWSGWIVGPVRGHGRGGLIRETGSLCVEHSTDRPWQFYDTQSFIEDPTIRISCFVPGEDGNYGRTDDDGEVVVGNPNFLHVHHHKHVHHVENGSYHGGRGRSLNPPGPAYNINSNPDYVEATFVFPNKKANGTVTSIDHLVPLAEAVHKESDSSDEVITEARNKNGEVLRRRIDNEEDVSYV